MWNCTDSGSQRSELAIKNRKLHHFIKRFWDVVSTIHSIQIPQKSGPNTAENVSRSEVSGHT